MAAWRWGRPRAGVMRVRKGAFELTKLGASRYDLTDPYHMAVTLPWAWFAVLTLAVVLAVNALFAGLYILFPGSILNARPGSFSDAFFFSIETLATVGYGVMAPASFYGHVVSSIEILTGLLLTAILTGLLFVRFSKPRAKLIFADRAVIARHNGLPALMIRVGNGRMTMMTDAEASVAVLLEEHTLEGRSFRRTFELQLVRSKNPLFALIWTLLHPIDETSPLHGFDAARLAAERVRLFVSVEARDRELAAQVFEIHDYGPSEILFDTRYADAVSLSETGVAVADLTRISLVEPDVGPPVAEPPPPESPDDAEPDPASAPA